jgi:hypothetical protein
VLYNPTEETITREITLPLYYTGLTETARVSDGDGRTRTLHLDREYRVRVRATIPAGGLRWFVIR